MIFPELKNIKIRRIKLGIKQKQLANLAGVSQSLVAKVEKGIIEPSYPIVKKLFLALESQEHKEEKKCSDIMTKRVISLNKNHKIKDAIDLMKKHSISQIPIIEREHIVGSIGESTIYNKILEGKSKESLFRLPIIEMMEEPFPTIRADTPISIIIPMLKTNSAVILIEKQKIVGIITKADLF